MEEDFEYLKELLAEKKMFELWNEAEAHCHNEEAFRWFRAQAEAGDHASQYILHVLYHERKGGSENERESFVWCKKAAEGGVIPAQKDLSYYYEKGIGTAEDLELAVYWLKTAAAKGDATALRFLGSAYNGGRNGLERDHEKAMECFYWSAMRGDRLARMWIGQAYLEGDVFPQDEAEGMKFLRAAANDGLDAAAYVAAVYYRDRGDLEEAAEWYRKCLEIVKNDPEDPMELYGASDEYIEAQVEGFIASSEEEEEWAFQEFMEEQRYNDTYDEEDDEE